MCHDWRHRDSSWAVVAAERCGDDGAAPKTSPQASWAKTEGIHVFCSSADSIIVTMAAEQHTNCRGLVSYGPHQSGGWKLQNLVTRPLRETELLVEIVASGICQTDLHFAGAVDGPGVHYPRVMGHEGASFSNQALQSMR